MGKAELGPQENKVWGGKGKKEKGGQPNHRITGKPGNARTKSMEAWTGTQHEGPLAWLGCRERPANECHMQSPESRRAYKLGSLSHEGQKQKLQIRASISERSIWSLYVHNKRWTGEPLKVTPGKNKNPGKR